MPDSSDKLRGLHRTTGAEFPAPSSILRLSLSSKHGVESFSKWLREQGIDVSATLLFKFFGPHKHAARYGREGQRENDLREALSALRQSIRQGSDIEGKLRALRSIAPARVSEIGAPELEKFESRVGGGLRSRKERKAQQATGDIEREATRRLRPLFKDGALDKISKAEMPERMAFLQTLASQIGVAVQLIEPPKDAPVLWADRNKSLRESPAEFIARVYAPYLGKGLTLADIGSLDRGLYRAYTALVPVGGKKPEGFDLPTLEEWNDRVTQNPFLLAQLDMASRLRAFRALSTREQKIKRSPS